MNCKLVFIVVCCLVAAAKCATDINSIIQSIQGVQDQLKGITTPGVDTAQNLLSKALELAKAQTPDVSQIKDVLDQAVTQLTSVTEVIPDAQKAVADQITSAMSSLTGIMSSMTDMISGTMNSVTGAMSKMMSSFGGR